MAVAGIKLPSIIVKICNHSRKNVMHTADEKRAPKGSVFVYVGQEHKKYVVPISLLSSSNFKGLLEEHEEEIQAPGPLTLPSCSTSEFEAVLKADHKGSCIPQAFEKMSLLCHQDLYGTA